MLVVEIGLWTVYKLGAKITSEWGDQTSCVMARNNGIAVLLYSPLQPGCLPNYIVPLISWVN